MTYRLCGGFSETFHLRALESVPSNSISPAVSFLGLPGLFHQTTMEQQPLLQIDSVDRSGREGRFWDTFELQIRGRCWGKYFCFYACPGEWSFFIADSPEADVASQFLYRVDKGEDLDIWELHDNYLPQVVSLIVGEILSYSESPKSTPTKHYFRMKEQGKWHCVHAPEGADPKRYRSNCGAKTYKAVEWVRTGVSVQGELCQSCESGVGVHAYYSSN